VVEKTGVQVKIDVMDWGKALPLLYAEHADVIDTISKNWERQQRLDFSAPYAKLEVPIFFHESISGISNVQNLGGFTVGVKDGDMAIDWLAAHGIHNFKKYPSYEAWVRSAKKDEIKVFVMGKAPTLHWLYKNKLENEFRHSASLYDSEFYWATRKGESALHGLIAQGSRQISADEREAIDVKWMGAPLGGYIDPRYLKMGIYTLLLALLIASGLVLLSWTLRRKVAAKTMDLSTATEALRVSESYNRMLFENTRLGMSLRRIDGVLVDTNQAFADILGLSIEKTLRSTVAQVAPIEYAEQDQQQKEILLSTGHYGPYDKEYIHQSGRRVPVRMIGTLIERGGEQFILSSIEDITA